MPLKVSLWDALHAVDFHFGRVMTCDRVWYPLHCDLVYLGCMDDESAGRVQLAMAVVALEVACLLVLYEDGIVVKVPVAVPAPGFGV